MNTIQRIWAQWHKDGTKMLGTLGTILPGTLLIDGLVPPEMRKWVLLADLIIGAVTIKRGYTNTANTTTNPGATP